MSDLVCKTENLSEKIRFEKQEVDRLKKEIFGTDKKTRTKYIRDFVGEFTDFQEVVTYDDLLQVARQSHIIYLADYHALDSYQKFQARFLEDLADRPLVLALEMLYGRNQRALDDWMSGQIEDDQFLRRVRYDLEWGYDWDSYRAVLEVARKHKMPAFGVDCSPRNDLRYIGKRDTAIAAKIVDLLRRYPGSTLVVCFGESHLASNHLPLKVKRQFAEGGAPRQLTVLQNIEQIYWKVACAGSEDESLVKVSDQVFCLFNATPFTKYEAYRRQLEVWRAHDQEEEQLDLTSTIYNLVNAIVDFIRIDKYSYCLTREGVCLEFFIDAYPEVYCFEDFDDFESLLQSNSFTKTQIHEIVNHTMRQGSCYVPRINAVFIGKFSLVHGAEEAAHFVNFALKRQRFQNYRPEPLEPVDEFYLTTLEEGLGYFGSKLIDPSRNQLTDSAILNSTGPDTPLKKMLGVSSRQLHRLQRFILTHKAMEQNYPKMRRLPKSIADGLQSRGRLFTVLTHELGYLLGEQLYRGYVAGRVSRKEISRLFQTRFEQQGRPVEAYLNLVARLEPLPLPATKAPSQTPVPTDN